MITTQECLSTTTAARASQGTWDVVVIGAGVAGSSVAHEVATRGMKVLLLESQPFPREKVCGGCLNERAQYHLEELGVLPRLHAMGAIEIHQLRVHVRGNVARWRVPKMLSIRRSTLDSVLLRSAIDAGVEFLSETRGTIVPKAECTDPSTRCVRLSRAHSRDEPSVVVRGAAVIVAAGLSRSPLPRDEDWGLRVADDSRVGVQCLMKADPAIYQTLENSKRAGGVDSSTAVLHMLLGEQGYLGICPADGGYIDFAAALDPAAIRSLGGIAPCIQSILSENAISMDGLLESAVWQATPLLTRTSTPLARSRVFLLGDSAGYVEPFTGEGMSWALAGARSLASILEKAVGAHRGAMASQPGIVSPEDEWKHWVVHQRGTRQTLANWVARQSRSVWKAKWVLKALDWAPPIRNFLVQKAMR